MKRLILMRHAKSDWSFELEDHARPLNKRGRKSAKALGRWLQEKAYLPDEVLCSTAIRTRETLDLLKVGVQTWHERALYLAPPEAMLECLRGADRNCVLMVGHNPGIAELAEALVVSPPPHPRFADYPTGATLVVDFDISDWRDLEISSGTVIDFIVPRELTEQAVTE